MPSLVAEHPTKRSWALTRIGKSKRTELCKNCSPAKAYLSLISSEFITDLAPEKDNAASVAVKIKAAFEIVVESFSASVNTANVQSVPNINTNRIDPWVNNQWLAIKHRFRIFLIASINLAPTPLAFGESLGLRRCSAVWSWLSMSVMAASYVRVQRPRSCLFGRARSRSETINRDTLVSCNDASDETPLDVKFGRATYIVPCLSG